MQSSLCTLGLAGFLFSAYSLLFLSQEIDPSAAASGLMNAAEYSGHTLPPSSHVQTIEVSWRAGENNSALFLCALAVHDLFISRFLLRLQ